MFLFLMQEELVRSLVAKHESCQPVVANMENTELREGYTFKGTSHEIEMVYRGYGMDGNSFLVFKFKF